MAALSSFWVVIFGVCGFTSWGVGEKIFQNLYYLFIAFDFTLFVSAFLLKNTQGWVLIFNI